MIKKIYLSKSDLEDFEKQWHTDEIEGFFITAAELEQREREAFEAGRELIKERIPRGAPVNAIACFEHKEFNDYLRQRKSNEK